MRNGTSGSSRFRHVTWGSIWTSIPQLLPTKKQHLAALRHFFDQLVTRHAVMLNPAASVRGERYQVVEGKTPEITVEQARRLLRSIDTGHVVGLRDRAIVGILVYTAARVGAVAKLRMRDYFDAGDQYCLRFTEKGGKSREIPVRHDLQQFLSSYLAAAGIASAAPDAPLFRTAVRRTKRLTEHANDRWRHGSHGQTPDAGRRPAGSPVTTFFPRRHDHRLAFPGRSTGRRPTPRRPRRPPHHAPVRPPPETSHSKHRRADLDLRCADANAVSHATLDVLSCPLNPLPARN